MTATETDPLQAQADHESLESENMVAQARAKYVTSKKGRLTIMRKGLEADAES
jgi:hypothetical protein